MNVYRLYKIGCVSALLLVMITVTLGLSSEQEVLLKSPGLRLVQDPFTIISADRYYPNQLSKLPVYRIGSGKTATGWARKYVKTRRFSSDQSALIYYRVSDLLHSNIIKTSNAFKTLHIWPVDTIIILESYKGNVNSSSRAKLLAIDILKKRDDQRKPSVYSFFPGNWSYTRLSPEGKPSITSMKVKECHQCHSIAFHITGDLVFTSFP